MGARFFYYDKHFSLILHLCYNIVMFVTIKEFRSAFSED